MALTIGWEWEDWEAWVLLGFKVQYLFRKTATYHNPYKVGSWKN